MDYLQLLDFSIFIIINLANIFASLMFIGRVKNQSMADISGKLFIFLGVPLFLIVLGNLFLLREWWYWIFPGILISFMVFSLMVDYIKKVEFRNPRNYRILIPFLLLYYIGLILTWGITWAIGVIYGIITMISYFMQLGASIYAGKHGVG
ncbi:MAG: conserved membrane protein of unknown function [Promethearchaeota archaeon]|nr:MAG: conserved membrane protein of unknown function [Candidatus Lokiarchaeota archaeon]